MNWYGGESKPKVLQHSAALFSSVSTTADWFPEEGPGAAVEKENKKRTDRECNPGRRHVCKQDIIFFESVYVGQESSI